MINILHLSDLHFGTLANARNWCSQLADDLKNRLDCSKLDILILSGDIANRSTPKEYKAAEQFIKDIQEEFYLDANQIVIVPGNHDLNWTLSKRAYRIKRIEDYKGPVDALGKPDPNFTIYKDGHDHVEVLSQAKYKQRFKHFSAFYEAVIGEAYPFEYSNQAILYHFPEHNLLILGLNSAWQLDHHYKSRVSVLQEALSHALDQIRNSEVYKGCLKFAVWHHPIISPGEDRLKTLGFMQRLAQAGFCVAFHGHVHKAEANQYRPEPVSVGGSQIHIVCAGTFGAPTKDWEPGYPLQYNYLKLVENQLIVETRCRRSLDGQWKPDAIWEPALGKDPLPRYEIALPVTRYAPEPVKTNSSNSQSTQPATKTQVTTPIEQKDTNSEQDFEVSSGHATEYRQQLEGLFATSQKSTSPKNHKSTLVIKRVLIIAVCPKDTLPLRLGEEVREICEALRNSKKFRFVVEVRWAARIQDLRESMLEFEPHIVHFCGHGTGENGLVFEDEQGNPHSVSPEALNELFTLFSEQLECLIECIVLSACYTSPQANAMIPYIGCVVGMDEAIGDKASIEFSKGFYQALSNGKTLDFAFRLGCNAIRTAGILEHSNPVFQKSDLFSGSLKIDNEPDGGYFQDRSQAQERILILAANPKETTRLRLDEEVREIYAVLKQAREQGEIALEQRWAARFNDLQEVLLEFRPTIIHFTGHGAGNEGLAFENETGHVQLVKAQPLSSLLKLFSSHVRCVILNAAYSQIQAQAVANNIDYVIGLPIAIGDKACIAFSRGFYRALGANLSLEEAHNLGCVELQLCDVSESDFPILNKKTTVGSPGASTAEL